MKFIIRAALFTLLAFYLLCAPVHAEELDIVNRPVNTTGLTGLLMTTAPYTLSPGTVELSASVLSEDSSIPDFTITEFPLSVTVGLKTNSELALRGSYFNIKEGPTGTTPVDRRTGDIELSYKWNFMPQPEASWRPGLALIVAGAFPADNNSAQKIDSVAHWGARLGISAGTEFGWKDHIVGIYADGQVAGQDLTESRLKDIYGIMNAGLLFPISKYRNLQMFIEYSLITRKDRTSLSGGDYTALTYGLRLVGERFNVTIGTQSLHKDVEGLDNSGRVVGLMSVKL